MHWTSSTAQRNKESDIIITEAEVQVVTLLYNHSLQDGALHRGETNIRPRTLSRYFV
jgi:hypothetical protein